MKRLIFSSIFLVLFAAIVLAVGSISVGPDKSVSTLQTVKIFCSSTGITPSYYYWYADNTLLGSENATKFQSWGSGPMWQSENTNAIYINYKNSTGQDAHIIRCKIKDLTGTFYQDDMTLTVINKVPTIFGLAGPSYVDVISPGNSVLTTLNMTLQDFDGKITAYSINWADGTNESSNVSPARQVNILKTHSYNMSGAFNITFTAQDNSNFNSTTTRIIPFRIRNVLPHPNINAVNCTDENAPVNDCLVDLTGSYDKDGFLKFVTIRIDNNDDLTEFHSIVDEGLKFRLKGLPNGDHGIHVRLWDNTFDNVDAPGIDQYYMFSVTNQRPTITSAGWTNMATEFHVDDSINFFVNAIDTDGNIASYSWNFGDNTTSAMQNPIHQYSALGTYTVKVKVLDNKNAPAYYSFQIIISGHNVLWYDFNECSGSNLSDRSNYSLSGTGINLGWVSDTGNCAGSFDGSSTKITTPNSALLNLTNFSVSAWFKPNSTSLMSLIVKGGADQSKINYMLFPNLKLDAKIGFGDHETTTQTSARVTNSSHWYLATLTYSNSIMRLYLDGALENETNTAGTPYLNSDDLIIGQWGATWYNGLIDDVRIFDYALEAQTVQTMYTNGRA